MQKAFIECACRKTAKRRATWAVVITKVEGGFMAFESANEYYTWRNQK